MVVVRAHRDKGWFVRGIYMMNQCEGGSVTCRAAVVRAPYSAGTTDLLVREGWPSARGLLGKEGEGKGW